MESRPNGVDASAPVPLSLDAQWRHYLDARQRAETAIALRLPSGMSVRARRPSLLDLVAAGRIPDALAVKVEGLIRQAEEAGGVQAELDRQRQQDPQAFYQTYLALLDVVWCEAVVEPRFARRPDEDGFPVAGVTVADKQYLFVWAQGADDGMATFPDRPPGAAPVVGTARAGADLRAGPGAPARDRPEG